MVKLGAVDLEIIYLGITKKGAFDENDIEKSSLKRLGVGRTLDLLASLKDRKLLDMNKDGSFSVTDLAKHILWDEATPTKVRILRLLEIRPARMEEVSEILGTPTEEVFRDIEELRKNQLILMSPLRQEGRLVKMYEVLPEGVEAIKKIETEGIQNAGLEEPRSGTGILELIDEIIADVRESGSANKETLIKKMNLLREKLDV